jgi:hypothetical protein
MDMPDLALEEARLKTLMDAVSDRLKQVKAQMQQQMETTGASRVDATLPDGTKVATISRPTPATEARVIDEELFRKWVQKHAPDGSVTVRVVAEVRPSYQKALLAELTAAGAPVWANKETGEVHDVPGVAVVPTRSTTHSVRPTKGGREAIAAAHRNGELPPLGLPQLGTGGGE